MPDSTLVGHRKNRLVAKPRLQRSDSLISSIRRYRARFCKDRVTPKLTQNKLGIGLSNSDLYVMKSVPGAVATGSQLPTKSELVETVTRSLPLPVLTSSLGKASSSEFKL